MKPNRRIFVVGGAHTPFLGKYHPDFIWQGHPNFGNAKNPTLEEHLGRAVKDALAVSDVEAKDIQKGYLSNFLAELFTRQGHLGAMLAAVHKDFETKPFARVEAACASGGVAVIGCIEAMQAGYDVVLAVGVEVETTARAKDGADYMAAAAHIEKEHQLDPSLFPYLFARRAKAYKEKYGISFADMREVVLKAYSNAKRNPYAQMHALDLRAEDFDSPKMNAAFLQDPELAPHMRLLDSTNFTDGASCTILATEDGLKKLGKTPEDCTEILSYAHHTRALDGAVEETRLVNIESAAQEAYGDAEIGPKDISVAEVHDCFSICEPMMTESLGFADAGRGVALLKSGATQLDGALPVNPGGGLLGFGHPVGATGIKQVVEIHKQMRGLSGDYQMQERPDFGISANMGGNDRTAVVMIQRRT